MQFIGASIWAWEDKLAYKVRNKLNVYVVPTQNFLDKYRDPRYFEFFMDFAGQIWVRRPAGTQELLKPPYTVVRRVAKPGSDVYVLTSEDFT